MEEQASVFLYMGAGIKTQPIMLPGTVCQESSSLQLLVAWDGGISPGEAECTFFGLSSCGARA